MEVAPPIMKSTSSMNDLFNNDNMPPRVLQNLQEQAQQQHQIHQIQAHNQVNGSPINSSYFNHTKVEGALAYLSQVKAAFSTEPQVYNQFLEIMKEFKAQRIDTAEVIRKVSTLFGKHRHLVVGFNSFLPPGYIISLSSNDNISVTFPSQISSSLQFPRASPPIRKLQQDVPDETPNEEIVAAPEPPASSSDKPLNCAKEIPVETEPQSSPKKLVPEDVASCPTDISSDVCNAARALHDNQPVEFNQAVKYVNKIKGRFYDQPDIYKQFLEILHSYQQEQKMVKEGLCLRSEVLSEAEVYAKVAELFGNQSDLLREFGQFLPDSSSSTASPSKEEGNKSVSSTETNHITKTESHVNNKPVSKSSILGKRPNHLSDVPKKKARTRSERNSSYSEAGKYGSLAEYQFFDKVRKALRNKEVYDSFLRCLILFNEEVVPKEELINLVKQFLGKFPELFKEFKNMLGVKDSGNCLETISNKVAIQSRKRVSAELEMEIDYSSCRKCGASYRALPSTCSQPKCSGRTNLCKEVLNDIWVSFPSWSEDSTFVSSRKTQYEEYIYRCEDERFELDVVLETNLSAIRALEAVMKKINRMPQEEKGKFHLDDTLGGTSEVIHQRAIRRIYGDKSADIIEGLKKNPVVAVPLVLRRLKAKEEEWREAQKNFNKQWREQNEKFYLKSLDHQGITFRQTDVKQLRSKNLLNEIETIYEEHHERVEEGIDMPLGPHMTLCYKHQSIMEDAADLIIHHAKRQTGISKEDKHKIKLLLRHFIPDLFELSRGDVSDDETEKVTDVEENSNSPQTKATDTKSSNISNSTSTKPSSNDSCNRVNSRTNSNSSNTSKKFDDSTDNVNKDNMDVEDDNVENDKELSTSSSHDHFKKAHNLFFVNNTWYLFFRLHHILCERLYKIRRSAKQLAKEEEKEKKDKKQSAAAALQIDSKNKVCLEESYLTFIGLAKSLLDGNIEITPYEDTLREMFGIHAYIVYTIDKVVQNIVRQLQTIVGDEVCTKYMELYNEFSKTGPLHPSYNTTGYIYSTESAYQKKAEQLQSDENCFKLVAYIDECKLTVELLDTEADTPEDPVECSKWAEYVDSYVTGKVHIPVTRHTRKCYKGAKVFLQRNIRKWECLAEEHTKEHTKHSSSDKEGVNHDDTSTVTSSTISDVQPIPPMECVRQKAMENMEVSDNTECKFNVNSYKMVFVVRSESYLYKRQSLRKVCQRRKQERLSKFQMWHKSWERRYLSGLKTTRSEKDPFVAKDIG